MSTGSVGLRESARQRTTRCVQFPFITSHKESQARGFCALFSRLLCLQEFSRQEYWSGLPWPPPGDHPNPGIKPRSSALQADSLPSEPTRKPKNTGVGSLSLLQGIFPTSGIKPGSPALQAGSLPAELPGKPKLIELCRVDLLGFDGRDNHCSDRFIFPE